MEPIIRAAVMYLFLMIVMRIAGSRTLSEITLFDFVLLMVIGDASQQAITANDYSVINAIVIIITFVCLDFIFTLLKDKFPKFERAMDGQPLILVINGKPQKKLMKKVHVGEDDILESARQWRGLTNMTQIKYAILEKDGEIIIIENTKT